MFGMSDPATVLTQMRRYASEARYEMAEVMASELTQRMIADKERDITKQDLLVQGLRDLANILEIRGKEKVEKLKLSLKASKELSKQRSKLAKLHKDAGDSNSAKATLANKADDEVQTGRVFALMGKKGKAMKKFARANKLRKHHLEACTETVGTEFMISGHLRKGAKHGRRLVDAMNAAGAVNRSGETFQLLPEGQRPAEVTSLISRVAPWSAASAGMPEQARDRLSQKLVELQSQIQRIESGEQAANAALSAAVDKLNPTMDYHSFSRS
ncbi:MAG: hypothetical protein QF707_00025 [Candidatus Poseidoniaceae archaeon]|jgi:hypothetical protein|nr:hypothetical protein [Candidatus Poseidoniaceae archaeon]MDP7202592.1 hypothetical protein [Candidatus Poseidoniaceae archaeon]|tara:strand:- start:281 stop:1093 length:813 start_codon:yes stop_codon:yes gene_type:complete